MGLNLCFKVIIQPYKIHGLSSGYPQDIRSMGIWHPYSSAGLCELQHLQCLHWFQRCLYFANGILLIAVMQSITLLTCTLVGGFLLIFWYMQSLSFISCNAQNKTFYKKIYFFLCTFFFIYNLL